MEIKNKNFLDIQLFKGNEWLTIEKAIYIALIITAVLWRFTNLGVRPMSHDESLHTYFSYLLSQGQGYQHNPMMHGPLQFHFIALSYFLFGSSDLVSRIPAATFGVLAVGAVWVWRRYLGRYGAIIAAIMMVFSPFLSYYSRYTREDSYVALSMILMLYATLRYFETGANKYLYIISGSSVIHYLTKETSFIYNAEMLIILALLFIIRLVKDDWNGNKIERLHFVIRFLIGLGFTLLTLVAYLQKQAIGDVEALQQTPLMVQLLPLFAGGAILSVGFAIFSVFRGFGTRKIRESRTFDLLIVFGTLVLPQLSAFPISMLGWDPMDYSMAGLSHIAMVLIPILLITVAIGFAWRGKVWANIALIFYIPYFLFYSTFFTNGIGVISGLVGSLGYWLSQQGVERGSQPVYYYPFITIPLYEFLPAIASLFAFTIAAFRSKKYLDLTQPGDSLEEEFKQGPLFIFVITFWSVLSIVAFSVAGEKMPWLTFHMALPLILLGAWGIRKLIGAIDWPALFNGRWHLIAALSTLRVISIIGAIILLFDTPTPFTGKDLPTLIATTSFIAAIVFAVGTTFAERKLVKPGAWRSVGLFSGLLVFVLLFLITVRVSYRANFVKFNSGQEYLVYAHSYTGTTDLLEQLNDLSEATVGGKDILVAYDDDTSWPLSWYMREYPNNRFYGGQPDRSLRDYTAIIVGDNNYTKLEPIVGDDYYQFDYIRMVWPNQDYFNLVTQRADPTEPLPVDYPCNGLLSPLKLIKTYDFSRVCVPLLSSDYRSAIFEIWLNGDFTKYAQVSGSSTVTDTTWEPTDKMRLYVKKEVVNELWSYGIKIEPKPRVDPYANGYQTLTADLTLGFTGSGPAEFSAPRSLGFAPDGTMYVADSRNHRIQHFSINGEYLDEFGSYADGTTGAPPVGTFNEPWGVAIAENGNIFVSDTWNHRVQKFSPDGTPLTSWGFFGTSENQGAMYGPRGIAISPDGRVFVADTGNQRILIFDQDGNQLGVMGSNGYEIGQFSEPVDVAIDSMGNVFVTDAWNQRVQVFSEIDGNIFTPVRSWEIDGWNSQSLDNKPYLAVTDDVVFVSDPEGYRILVFTHNGDFLYAFGQFGNDLSSFGLPNGLAIDPTGGVWIADAGNDRLVRFMLEDK